MVIIFVSLIIRLFILFFFQPEEYFFSYDKSAGTVFRLVFSAKRTGQKKTLSSNLLVPKTQNLVTQTSFALFACRTFSTNEQYFSLTPNQATLLSAMAYQPYEQDHYQ